jgi:hypothetical protein
MRGARLAPGPHIRVVFMLVSLAPMSAVQAAEQPDH